MKVYVTRPIPETGIKLLRDKGYIVDVNPDDKVLTQEQLIEKLNQYDGVLTLLTDKLTSEVISKAGSQLKIIANYAVGFDNIDIPSATKKKIYVTNTPGVLTEAVAEHTFALLMAVAKRVVEADSFVREGKYNIWEPMGFLGPQIWGKTIGIVGLGRIGSFVAQIAHAGFQMKVLYYDVKRNEEFEMRFSATYQAIGDILKNSDFITLHVPLLDSTKHLINEDRLKLMKKEAILINTARGPVVDEKALVKALKNKTIAGAGLDVFENEPELEAGLKDLENVVLTPHIASATVEAREAMSRIAAENIIAAFEGKEPPNLVKL